MQDAATAVFQDPPHNGTTTSRLAAEAKIRTLARSRDRVLAYIRSQGAAGATRDEIDAALGMPIQSVCARCDDLLKAQPPLIRARGDKRKTRRGCFADVMVG
jgi:hypothetical protein